VVAHVESHGKAVIVKGDTREIKDFLKGFGGKWNKKLVGWIFQGSKRGELLKALGSNAKVSSVIDRTGGTEAAAAASSAPAAAAVKRAADDSDRQDEEALVATKPATAAVQVTEEDGGIVFAITDTLRVTVNSFKGKHGVDIRKFYQDNTSKKFLPTAKGIRLRASEWKALCSKFSKINAAPADESKLEVEGDIFAMKKTGIVDIRRFYTDKSDGELKHTKKGAYMQQDQWRKLQEIAAQVDAALEDPPKSKGSPRKKQRTEKEAPAASTSAGTDGPLSPKQLKTELKKLLKGRDLGAITLKSVRSELEAKLSLPDGGLASRKDEMKTIITWIVQKGAAGEGSP